MVAEGMLGRFPYNTKNGDSEVGRFSKIDISVLKRGNGGGDLCNFMCHLCNFLESHNWM